MDKILNNCGDECHRSHIFPVYASMESAEHICYFPDYIHTCAPVSELPVPLQSAPVTLQHLGFDI